MIICQKYFKVLEKKGFSFSRLEFTFHKSFKCNIDDRKE